MVYENNQQDQFVDNHSQMDKEPDNEMDPESEMSEEELEYKAQMEKG